MYTIGELVTRSGATERQIKEWNRDGLLPESEQYPVPGRPGPGLLRFRDPTLRVVQWLAQHRRSIDGPDRTKVWLWLEGYDHVNISPDQLETAIKASVGAAWLALHSLIPSLPTDAFTPENEQVADDICRIAEKYKRGRDSESAQVLERGIAIGILSVVGMAAYPEDRDTPFTVFQALESVGDYSANRVPVNGLGPDDCLPLETILAAVSIPDAVERRCDIHYARLLWRTAVSIIELGQGKPSLSPWVNMFSAVRRRLYATDPHWLIFCLSAAGSSIAREEDIGPQCRRIVAQAERLRRAAMVTTAQSTAAS